MFTRDNIILRRLTKNDRPILAILANNKKIWDNVRDLLPFPYTENDAADFIKMTMLEEIPMTFAIAYEGQFCGVIGLSGTIPMFIKKQLKSDIGLENLSGIRA